MIAPNITNKNHSRFKKLLARFIEVKAVNTFAFDPLLPKACLKSNTVDYQSLPNKARSKKAQKCPNTDTKIP